MSLTLDFLATVALEAAADLIDEVLEPSPYKRRLIFKDKSFLDLFLSVSRKGLYAFHFERRHINGTLWRVDNYPHHRSLCLSSDPHHFHERKDRNVVDSPFGKRPEEVLINLLHFIRKRFYT